MITIVVWSYHSNVGLSMYSVSVTCTCQCHFHNRAALVQMMMLQNRDPSVIQLGCWPLSGFWLNGSGLVILAGDWLFSLLVSWLLASHVDQVGRPYCGKRASKRGRGESWVCLWRASHFQLVSCVNACPLHSTPLLHLWQLFLLSCYLHNRCSV